MERRKKTEKKRQKSIREREREPAKEMYLGGFARKKLKSQENLFEALVLASLPALGLLELSLSTYNLACLIIKTTTRTEVVIPVCPVLINSRRMERFKPIYVRFLMKRPWRDGEKRRRDKEEIRIDASLAISWTLKGSTRQCKHFAVYISISLMLKTNTVDDFFLRSCSCFFLLGFQQV
jgi:hypothetical protein